MRKINIIRAEISDLEDILSVVEDAKLFLKENGVDQWQDGYPNEEVIRGDVSGNAYVLKCENETVGYFFFTSYERSYDEIYGGEWKSSPKYLVLHRIALKNAFRGQSIPRLIYSFVEDFALNNGYLSLRIDTHEDNKIMRKSLIKNGFEYAGIIYLYESGAKRLAYEKNIG